MAEVKVDIEFGMGNISIGNETVDNWKTASKYYERNFNKGCNKIKWKG